MSTGKTKPKKSKAVAARATASPLPEATLQPVSVEQQPLPTAYIPQDNNAPATARLKNCHTGRVITVSYKTAKGLSERYPKEFEIVE